MESNYSEINMSALQPPPPSPSQEQKMALINLIKEWVRNDNEIRELKKQEQQRKESNKQITIKLLDMMKSHNIDSFDMSDGEICYKKTNVKKPFSKKILHQLLLNYFDNDEMKANNINEYLLENQEFTTKEKIVRKISK